jgi:hypothetical protein
MDYKTEDYLHGLHDFDDPSKIIVLRFAYHMGECFVRNFPDLAWSVGEADTALRNKPVVSGFRGGQEMPPMLVAENLFRRVLSGRAGENMSSKDLCLGAREIRSECARCAPYPETPTTAEPFSPTSFM